MKRIIVNAGMSAVVIRLLDGYKDDKIACTFVDKKGIACAFDVETELEGDTLAAYVKKVIKGMPEGVSLYFQVKAE